MRISMHMHLCYRLEQHGMAACVPPCVDKHAALDWKESVLQCRVFALAQLGIWYIWLKIPWEFKLVAISLCKPMISNVPASLKTWNIICC